MADFSHLGGPSEEWLVVQKSLPVSKPNLDVNELKAVTNRTREAAAARAFEEFASLVATQDFTITTRDGFDLGARTYRSRSTVSDAQLPIVVHIHGGGFLFGTLNSEDATCARIAAAVDVVVINVDYRHTPEYIYPTAWEDIEDAIQWTYKQASRFAGDAERIFLEGISAGGYISASLTLQQHLASERRQIIKGQMLLIPNLIHIDCYELYQSKMKDRSKSSLEENKNAPILPREMIKLFTGLLQVKNPVAEDTKLNPGNATAEDVRGLPPTFIVTAGLDALRDEALLYGKLLADNGVPTKTNLIRGVPHGFRRFGDQLTASQKWDRLIADGIRWLVGSEHESVAFKVTEW